MRKSEERRFREFAREQSAALRRTGYLLSGDWHLAADLTQQTLIKLYRAWTRLECVAQPVSYARKVLLRCWLDERRRVWRGAELRDGEVPDTADDSPGPDERQERAVLRAQLFRSLDTLPPRQRAVLVLRFFESLSVTETAAVLGCSEGTVKSQASRGLVALRTGIDSRSATAMREFL
ncbi:RNA polymerase sigma factor [Actinophytocola sediminis]